MDGIREPEGKSQFGGEVENHVAMNRWNGMKRSLNDKRAKVQTWWWWWWGGNKSQRHEGGGERRYMLGLCWDFVSMTFNIQAFTVKG